MKKILLLSFLILQIAISNAQPNIVINANPASSSPCDTCFIFSANLNGWGTAPFAYEWNINNPPVATGTSATISHCFNHIPNAGDTIYLKVTDAFGQIGYGFMIMNSIYPILNAVHSICIVTVDSASGKNIVVWEQSTDTTVASYNLFKETTMSGVYALVGNILRNSFSIFLDTSSHPEQVAARYKISMLDHCGFESQESSAVKTIHLTVSAGLPGTWNLNWDNAEGFPVVKFRIWRKHASQNPMLIDSVQSSLNSYSDVNAPAGLIHYFLEAISTNVCYPSMKGFFSSFSNFVDNSAFLGVNEEDISKNISVNPNPFSTSAIFTIDSGVRVQNSRFELFDVFGKQVKSFQVTSQRFEIVRGNFPSGIYFYKLCDENKIISSGKIIIQ
ncbi:MAG: T9SS type A sorting domain-containing protein [Bacteroidetes bacterium]|nr:T9SS type A sorting domain-containing protein [Bacteroidota bacterium]